MAKLLIIGRIFPEPETTAAGKRMLQLIQLFQQAGYAITFATSATTSKHSFDLSKVNIEVVNIELNNPSFDRFVSNLAPGIVLFDRFMTEEQFGWRVSENCPDAVQILDTEDLHFLRNARKKTFSEGADNEPNLYSELAKRELASIFRTDISLIISQFEYDLLRDVFKIPASILYYLPFLIEIPSAEKINSLPEFNERSDFIAVGNMQHAPNVDAFVQLKTKIWPEIRKQLPEARLHIYGAYASGNIAKMHDEREGILIEGWTEDLAQKITSARLCLAPLRFGAGLKGKIIECMINGTPVITSSIGAEGIASGEEFPGIITDEPQKFILEACSLYKDADRWARCQKIGYKVLKEKFDISSFRTDFIEKIRGLQNDLEVHRRENFIGQVMRHHALQSTKYMSKWIEEKNK